MANAEKKICAHPACKCAVADDKKHCSEGCEHGHKSAATPCGCAHPACSSNLD
jgi:hypothetical protein